MKAYKKDKFNRLGFTVIELLVVISIIAILTAIMMPALRNVRSQAMGTVCKNNVRNAASALSIYCYDNRGRLIEYGSSKDSWIGTLDGYIGETDDQLLCPSAKAAGSNGIGWVTQAWGPGLVEFGFDDELRGSYGINGWLTSKSGDDKLSGNKVWKNISACQNDTPMFADCVWWEGRPEDMETFYPRSQSWLEDYLAGEPRLDNFHMARFSLPRHEDGVNVIFADGSASQISLSDLWNIKWHMSFKKNPRVSIVW